MLLKNNIVWTLVVSTLLAGCGTGRFDKPVTKYATIRHVFPAQKRCIIVNPFTASPDSVEKFTPEEAKSLARSFCQAIADSGFSDKATTEISQCGKETLIVNVELKKRVLEKKYGLIIPHILLAGIPAIIGWPTTREICSLEMDMTLSTRTNKQPLGTFHSSYQYKEVNNLYTNSASSPFIHHSIPLGAAFEQLIEKMDASLSNNTGLAQNIPYDNENSIDEISITPIKTAPMNTISSQTPTNSGRDPELPYIPNITDARQRPPVSSDATSKPAYKPIPQEYVF